MFVQIIEARLKDSSAWETLRQLSEEWDRNEAQRAPGFAGEEWVRDRKDPNHIIGIVHFESAEKAQENSSRPATNEFYRKFVALLEGEPRFIDCDQAYAAKG